MSFGFASILRGSAIARTLRHEAKVRESLLMPEAAASLDYPFALS